MLFTIGWPDFFTFVTGVVGGEVHADNAHADGIAAGFSEFVHLADEVSDDAVDLLDHSLSKDLGFGSNFDGCNLAAGDEQSCFSNGQGGRNKLAGAIATPARFANSFVAEIDDTLVEFEPAASFSDLLN
jgi:hypothetical protein